MSHIAFVRSVRSGASVLAVVLAGALLVGCSAEGEDDGADLDYVDAVASAWSRVDDTQVSEAQARCWGQKIVDRVGLDRVRSTGLPVDFGAQSVAFHFPALALTAAEAQGVHDDFGTCGADLGGDRDLLVAEIGLPEQMTACVAEGIDDATMEEFLLDTLENGGEQAATSEETLAGLEKAMAGCISDLDPELQELLAETAE